MNAILTAVNRESLIQNRGFLKISLHGHPVENKMKDRLLPNHGHDGISN
jgi:hypothetical protein